MVKNNPFFTTPVTTVIDHIIPSEDGRATCLQVSPSQASAEVLSTCWQCDNRIIDLENASLGTGSILTDDGYSYAFITKGAYNTLCITNSDQYRGYSIAYAMPPTTVSGSITNDKSQHRIFSGSDANALAFMKKYFLIRHRFNNAMPANIYRTDFPGVA